tara:strand:+ start:3495 stop:3683 length:189 start_codon:yes stop_codon:yes gene_type:complete
MTDEDTKKLREALISQVVSRISLSETINVVHALAKNEVEEKVDNMTDEEKDATFKELFEKQV